MDDLAELDEVGVYEDGGVVEVLGGVRGDPGETGGDVRL